MSDKQLYQDMRDLRDRLERLYNRLVEAAKDHAWNKSEIGNNARHISDIRKDVKRVGERVSEHESEIRELKQSVRFFWKFFWMTLAAIFGLLSFAAKEIFSRLLSWLAKVSSMSPPG